MIDYLKDWYLAQQRRAMVRQLHNFDAMRASIAEREQETIGAIHAIDRQMVRRHIATIGGRW